MLKDRKMRIGDLNNAKATLIVFLLLAFHGCASKQYGRVTLFEDQKKSSKNKQKWSEKEYQVWNMLIKFYTSVLNGTEEERNSFFHPDGINWVQYNPAPKDSFAVFNRRGRESLRKLVGENVSPLPPRKLDTNLSIKQHSNSSV